jgi:DNA topoisomerase III
VIGILCEKPSAARNFATALGGMNGTYNGEQYKIVASRGHLYGFDDDPSNQVSPELKDRYGNWNLDLLPWNEEDMLWKYKKKSSAENLPEELASTLKECDEVCIATDDDPTGEGELLAWEILWQKKVKVKKYTRMYFADEAPASIQKAFKERKLLGTDINCMYNDADWKQATFRTKWDYMSMQWSRVATKINNSSGQVLRNGRLKSAMVVIVGDQLKLVKDYVKKPFYQNRFKDENNIIYKNDEEPKFDKKEDVPNSYHESESMVDSKETKETNPPKFLDLATLSSMLAPKGIPAKTTLATYQKMYEAGVVSYPRTEDKCITAEQFDQLLPLVDRIADLIGVDKSLLSHRAHRKTHIKDGMAHGANRPGLTVPTSIKGLDSLYGQGAELIYTTLARNYLATLAENYVYEQQKGHLKDYPSFKGVANVPKSLGWKAVFDEEQDIEEDDTSKGLGTIASPFVYEGANQKPTAPTMKWLMKQLEKRSVGTGATRTSTYSDVTNSSSKFPLLVDTKGKITFAPCGEANYYLLGGTHIADLELTERVTEQMKHVADGTGNPDEYLHEIQQMVIDDIATMKANRSKYDSTGNEAPTKEKASGEWKVSGNIINFSRTWGVHRFTGEEVEQLLNGDDITFEMEYKGTKLSVTGNLQEQIYNGHNYVGFAKTDSSIIGHSGTDTGLKCPRCGKPIIESQKAYACSDSNCGWIIWKDNKYFKAIGYNMTQARAKELIEKGKVLAKGLTSKKGSKYDAYIKLKDDGQHVGFEMEFPEKETASSNSLGNCPLCGKPVIENSKAYGCSGWRDGCKFAVWKQQQGKAISAKMVAELLENGKSSSVSGFKSWSAKDHKFNGKAFKGHLELENGAVMVKKG